MIRSLLILVLVGSCIASSAQQMVVMKRGKVLHRYNLGDDIRFVLKGDQQTYHAAILQIREFDFLTLQKDTIRYAEIETLRFKNSGLKKFAVSTVIASASLLALSFVLKEPLEDKNPNVSRGMAYAAGAGLVPVLFAIVTNKSKIELTNFKRIRFVNYDSPMYR